MFTAEYHTQVTHRLADGTAGRGDRHLALRRHQVDRPRRHHRQGQRRAPGGDRAASPNSPLARKADLFLQLPTGPLPGSAEVLDRIVAIGLAQVVFECLTARRPDMLAASVRIDDAFNEDRI